jgi:bacillithiol system protein YtxJ
MNWQTLNDIAQIDHIKTKSFDQPQVIFKHSTTCSISRMALGRLERETPPDNVDFYYLDLLNHRPVSHAVAEQLQVHHESPQVIVLKNGEVVYDESHYAINMPEIVEQTKVNQP